MEVLELVIQSLTSDEVRRFKILSNRFKADEEKKLILLFDAVRSGKFENDEENLLSEVYGNSLLSTKNKYYRLRNKLLDSIEKSLVFYHFKYKDSIHAFYDIQLSIMFRERGYHDLSVYFLKKAEKKAEMLDQFNILELIYDEYIQLGIKNVDIDLEEILLRRKANLKKLELHRRSTETIATIKHGVRKAKFNKDRGSVIDLLDKIRDDLEEAKDLFHSTEGKILIFQTVSTLLHNQGAYKQLADYIFKTISEFETEDLFDQNNHSTRLLMRLRLIISLYKTWRLEEAVEQLAVFESEMKMFNRQNYQTYLFNYFNIKIYNLKMLGRSDEALEAIELALKLPEIKNDPAHFLVIQISFAGQMFNLERFGETRSSIEEIRHSKHASLLGANVLFYLEVFYMVVLFELKEYARLDSTYKSFRKKFKQLLKSELNARATRFSEILMRMNDAAQTGRKVSIRSTTDGFVEAFIKSSEGENEIINPIYYLRALKEKRPFYEVYLEELKKRIIS